jgi:hypothetical protein
LSLRDFGNDNKDCNGKQNLSYHAFKTTDHCPVNKAILTS